MPTIIRFGVFEQDLENEELRKAGLLINLHPHKYRVFLINLKDPIPFVVWFYNQRAGAENLIKEANNDAGLAAHPSSRFDVINTYRDQFRTSRYRYFPYLL